MRRSTVIRRGTVVGAAAAAAAALLLQPTATSASGSGAGLPLNVGSKHVLWSAGATAPSTTGASANNLIYHGGLVETKPAVYVVYWGPQWKSGFSFAHGGFTYTNTTVTKYVNSFFSHVGGSPWAGVQTQYCQNMGAAEHHPRRHQVRGATAVEQRSQWWTGGLRRLALIDGWR